MFMFRVEFEISVNRVVRRPTKLATKFIDKSEKAHRKLSTESSEKLVETKIDETNFPVIVQRLFSLQFLLIVFSTFSDSKNK